LRQSISERGKELKVAIAGAGITGAYLYRLLRNRGQEVEIFGRDPGTRCGLNPCAWGTSRGFAELVKISGLDPEKYWLRRSDYVTMDGGATHHTTVEVLFNNYEGQEDQEEEPLDQ